MAKRIMFLVVGVVFAVALGAAPPPTPTTAPGGVQAIQQVRAQVARLAGSQWEKVAVPVGAAAAVARPSSKMIWLTAVNVPGQDNAAEAGFRFGPLSSGVAVPDATANVTFDIHMFRGGVTCKVVVAEDMARQVAFGSWRANAAGSHDVTTPRFTMQPGKQYTIIATVLLRPGSDPGEPGAVAVAKIPDIGCQL